MKQTETFQMLSDETRLRALALMDSQGMLCVCELMHALKFSQPKISRHMAALRDAGLVTPHRQAQWVFYQINEDMPQWQKDVLKGALAGVADEATIKQDATRLSQMKSRPQRQTAA